VRGLRWGLEWLGHLDVPAHGRWGGGYVPDVFWFAARCAGGVVVCFRGADPVYQISRRADVPIAKTRRGAMGGVLDGFHRCVRGNATGSAWSVLTHAMDQSLLYPLFRSRAICSVLFDARNGPIRPLFLQPWDLLPVV
jgi:hypothetical protein